MCYLIPKANLIILIQTINIENINKLLIIMIKYIRNLNRILNLKININLFRLVDPIQGL